MTREELAKAVKDIREHCKNNSSCRNCEAHSIYGCIFIGGSPSEWAMPEKSYKDLIKESEGE